MTLATAAADRTTDWMMVCTISGHGSKADGLYVYSVGAAANAFAGYTFRPWVAAGTFPDVLGEKSPPLGGVVSAAQFQIQIVDIDDSLTSEWRTDADPVTTLSEDVVKSSLSTTFDLQTTSGLSSGDYVWIGDEVMKVTVNTGTQVTCQRALLDTEPQKHYAGSAVFTALPKLLDRRVRVYLMPVNADTFSSTDVYQFGTFFITGYTLDASKNVWSISAKSDLRYVEREIATEPLRCVTELGCVDFQTLNIYPKASSMPQATEQRLLNAWSLWPENQAYLLIGSEVVLMDTLPFGGVVTNLFGNIIERGKFNTKIDEEEPSAESEAVIVFGSDTNGPCAFRHDPTNTETTRNEKWIKSNHPCDIMLCLLTSSAFPNNEDGLELTNGGALGNWSCLSPGMGLGISYDAIDVQSFLDVKSQMSYEFPNLWFGDEPVQFASWVTENFLKPIGLQLTSTEGKISLRFPTLPLAGSQTTTWTNAVFDAFAKNDLSWEDGVVGGPDTSNIYNVVQYHTPSPYGRPDIATFRDRDFDGWNIARGDFSSDRTLIIEVQGMTLAQESQFWDLAARRLLRFHKPLWKLKLRTGFDQYDVRPGDVIALSHDDLPNLKTGTRGWSGVLAVVLSREFQLRDRADMGIEWEILSYGYDARFGRVAPSAYINEVTQDGSNYVCTVASSMFAVANAQNNLPTSDADAFSVGDEVILMDPDVSNAGGASTQTIVALTSTTITIDGNFGGALTMTGGEFLGYADRDTSVAAQHQRYVYLAGKTDSPPNIQSSTDSPWRFGDG